MPQTNWGAQPEYKKIVDGKPRTSSTPYTYDIAEGNVSGHTSWSKIGYRSASTSATEVAVAPYLSAAEYVFPAAVMTMQIVSDQAADAAGNTGARTVTVYYLDSNYIEKSVTVTMNGATPVDIATDMFRVQNVRVASAGTDNSAKGNITVKGKVDSKTYGYIRAAKTRQRQCIWTVPAGKTLYVLSFFSSATNMGSTKYTRLTIKATYDEKANTVLRPEFFMPYDEVGLMNDHMDRYLDPPMRIPAATDLKVVAETNDTGAVITCALRGWVEVT